MKYIKEIKRKNVWFYTYRMFYIVSTNKKFGFRNKSMANDRYRENQDDPKSSKVQPYTNLLFSKHEKTRV